MRTHTQSHPPSPQPHEQELKKDPKFLTWEKRAELATPESGLTPVFEESFKTFKSKEPTYPGGLPAPPWPLKSLSDLEADPDPDGEGQYFRMDAVIDKKNYLAATCV